MHHEGALLALADSLLAAASTARASACSIGAARPTVALTRLRTKRLCKMDLEPVHRCVPSSDRAGSLTGPVIDIATLSRAQFKGRQGSDAP